MTFLDPRSGRGDFSLLGILMLLGGLFSGFIANENQDRPIDLSHRIAEYGQTAAPPAGRPTGSSSPFHQAAADGDVNRLKEFLGQGKNVNARDQWNNTPLMYAAANGHLEAVRVLVSANAQINSVNNSRKSALILSLEGPHHKVADFLVDSGADYRTDHPEGTPMLHVAAITGNFKIAEKLLQEGVPVDIPAFNNWTALQRASYFGQLEMVKLLIRHGADPRLRNNYTYSDSFELAGRRGFSEVVKALQNAPAERFGKGR